MCCRLWTGIEEDCEGDDCERFSRFGKPAVSEVEVVFPILGSDVVFSLADVEAHQDAGNFSWFELRCRSTGGLGRAPRQERRA